MTDVEVAPAPTPQYTTGREVDPDAGLQVRPEFAAGLQAQQERVRAGETGTPLDETLHQARILRAFIKTYQARMACEGLGIEHPISVSCDFDDILKSLRYDMTDATRHKAHNYEREQRRPGRTKP